ncbi:hypothetical protein [Castellaniella sp.]|uniref:bestrophin-like domain n=1 Tax=Castellaniella sp. TaxID=1955812 RepID=UPI003C7234A8
MFDFMYQLPDSLLFIFCVMVVGLITVLSWGAIWLFRLAWPNRRGTAMVNTMLSGILLPAGLVIAFVASDVWQQENRGRIAVEQEAIAVSDTLRVAQHLPPGLLDQATGLVSDYIREVVEQEWPLMGNGQSSAKAESLLDALEQTSVQVDVAAADAGPERTGWRLAAMDLRHYTQEIEKARNQRLLVASGKVVATKWIAVLVLLFVAACVICELHAPQRRAMVLALILFSLGFGATLYLIASYDRPFTGSTIIQPRSLTLMLLKN